MQTVEMKISELQPGDYLSASSQRYLGKLPTKEILKLEDIHVYETAAGRVIFDGNNKTRVLQDRGYQTINVRYLERSEIPSFIEQEVEDVLKLVEKLRIDGVYSVTDNKVEVA